jgi:CubicO group peptidase (beta-lactamase class C family)
MAVVIGLVCLVSAGDADAHEFPWAERVTDGFRQNARVAYVKASARPIPLQESKDVASEGKAELDTLFESAGSRALIVAIGGRIKYERYSQWGGSRRTPLGMSMSKSLTALAVGKALCAGHIRSLDDPLQDYVSKLKGTSWGESPIREVLKMASGAYATALALNGYKTTEQGASLASVYEGRMNDDLVDLLRREDLKEYSPGARWSYSNLDTLALGLLVEQSTGLGLSEFFRREVWDPAGAEADGAWVVNNRRQPTTYSGFSARPRDWLRLGLWVLAELEEPDTCFGRYLAEGVSPLIRTRAGPATDYGFQIWVNCTFGVDFCFVGYGGQYLLFNKAKQAVLYHHAATPSTRVYAVPASFGFYVTRPPN